MAKAHHPQTGTYRRFTASQRFEHILLLVSFTVLALTGLPQKYASHDWAKTMIDVMGGIESVRIVHRFMATLLMAESIFHIGMLGYKIFVRGQRLTMLPTLKDVKDVFDEVRYNLGLSRTPPRFPRYSYGEKAEYLAVVWGTLIMVLTGFMLWNPIATTNLFPGTWIPAARAAHGAEALLAVASIVTWHMYHVHIKHFNRAMFTGHLSREQMEHEHAEELAAIEAGRVHRDPPPDIIARRRRTFWPFAAIFTAIMLGGLIYFVTFEESAIATVPRIPVQGENLAAVDPNLGNAARGAALWIETECNTCHGPEGHALEGLASFSIARTNLSFTAFVTSVRRGPAEMPAYSPDQISGQDLADVWVWLKALPGQ